MSHENVTKVTDASTHPGEAKEDVALKELYEPMLLRPGYRPMPIVYPENIINFACVVSDSPFTQIEFGRHFTVISAVD